MIIDYEKLFSVCQFQLLKLSSANIFIKLLQSLIILSNGSSPPPWVWAGNRKTGLDSSAGGGAALLDRIPMRFYFEFIKTYTEIVMKKTLVILSLVLVFSNPLFAKNLDFIESGEYAYYYDTRFSDPYFRGYWFFHKEEGGYSVICRSVNMKTAQEGVVSISFNEDPNGYPIVAEMKTYIDNDSQKDEFFQAIPDFLNFASLRVRNKDKIYYGTAVTDDFGIYIFNKCLPVFGLLSYSSAEDVPPFYILNSGGKMDIDQAKEFLSVRPFVPHEKKRYDAPPVIGQEPSKKVISNGIEITLDDRWHINESLGFPSYWLDLTRPRDSQIGVEMMPLSKMKKFGLNPDKFLKYMILFKGPTLDFTTMVTTLKEGRLSCRFAVFDDSGVKNYQFITITEKDDTVYILNFSTFADIFDRNRDYYEMILVSTGLYDPFP
jgi:hypothetical protein